MKKIILTVLAAVLCAGTTFASGKHHNKVRKGEVAAGIAAVTTHVIDFMPVL